MAPEFEESFGIIPLRHIEDDWKIFVILHKFGNHWGFPKGKGEEGEDPFESAARELLEETGLKVEKQITDSPIIENYSFRRRGRAVSKQVTYYPAVVSGAILLQPEEIRDGKWLSLDDARTQLTFIEGKRVCDQIKILLQP